VSSDIRDVEPGDVLDAMNGVPERLRERGMQALREGRVALGVDGRRIQLIPVA
jgi:hypothetical protein